jgi:hypothetical protein
MIQTGLKTFELKQVIVTKKRMGSERVADQIQITRKEIFQCYPDKQKNKRKFGKSSTVLTQSMPHQTK